MSRDQDAELALATRDMLTAEEDAQTALDAWQGAQLRWRQAIDRYDRARAAMSA